MKKLLLVSSIAFLSAAGYAQTASKYCELVVYKPYFKNFVAEMQVDGHKKHKETVLRDNIGNPIKFATKAEALNYVSAKGWELVSAFSRSHSSETHFILKRSNS